MLMTINNQLQEYSKTPHHHKDSEQHHKLRH